MKRNVRPIAFLLSFFIVTVVLFSAACAPAGLIALAGTPKPDSAAMDAPVATLTATLCPTPSTTPQFSEERKTELNRRIQDFLNKEGDYTPKEISSKAFAMSSLPDENSLQLGLADCALKIGCILFDYIEKNDNLILLLGFDGNDNNRFVAPVQIPLYFMMNGQKNYHFAFMKHYKVTFYDECVADASKSNVYVLYHQLDQLKEGYLVISVPFNLFSGSESDYDGVVLTYFKEHNSKIGFSLKLASSVASNGFDLDSSLKQMQLAPNLMQFDLSSYTIPIIKNLDDLDHIDVSMIPLLDPVIYFTSPD